MEEEKFSQKVTIRDARTYFVDKDGNEIPEPKPAEEIKPSEAEKKEE